MRMPKKMCSFQKKTSVQIKETYLSNERVRVKCLAIKRDVRIYKRDLCIHKRDVCINKRELFKYIKRKGQIQVSHDERRRAYIQKRPFAYKRNLCIHIKELFKFVKRKGQGQVSLDSKRRSDIQKRPVHTQKRRVYA